MIEEFLIFLVVSLSNNRQRNLPEQHTQARINFHSNLLVWWLSMNVLALMSQSASSALPSQMGSYWHSVSIFPFPNKMVDILHMMNGMKSFFLLGAISIFLWTHSQEKPIYKMHKCVLFTILYVLILDASSAGGSMLNQLQNVWMLKKAHFCSVFSCQPLNK